MLKQFIQHPLNLKQMGLLVIISVFSTVNLAQEKHNDPVLGLDFVNQQLAEQMLNQTKALSNPSLVKAQADYYRAMYQALIESGFNKDEALKIVVAIASKDD
jgi:hypothetical protein